jgi:hypothetical protein
MRSPLPLIVAIVVAIPCTAAAQRGAGPVPDQGMTGVGISIGGSLPSDAGLMNGFEIAGNIETYLSPRVSLRGQVAWTKWDIVGRGFKGSVKPLVFDGNVVYNWEGGAWHPYVTAGIGLYHYAFDIDGLASDAHDNKFGANLGGGIEGFLTRHTTFTGEVLYHAVQTPAIGPVGAFESRFWSLRGGFKHYF